jgi:hypothetical protein
VESEQIIVLVTKSDDALSSNVKRKYCKLVIVALGTIVYLELTSELMNF